jgi:hypothetical protein
MSNQLHLFLEEAFANAPVEPDASYYEMSLIGITERQLHSIHDVLDQARARGLIVELHANGETLGACGLDGESETGGFPIVVGSTEQTGYVKFRFSKPVRRR